MTEETRNDGHPEGTEKQSRHSSLAAKLVICVGKAQLQAVPVTDDIILGQEQKRDIWGFPPVMSCRITAGWSGWRTDLPMRTCRGRAVHI